MGAISSFNFITMAFSGTFMFSLSFIQNLWHKEENKYFIFLFYSCFWIFREDLARIYAAEIVSAVSHLHASGIMHRDLKPENILVDADGHVLFPPSCLYDFWSCLIHTTD